MKKRELKNQIRELDRKLEITEKEFERRLTRIEESVLAKTPEKVLGGGQTKRSEEHDAAIRAASTGIPIRDNPGA